MVLTYTLEHLGDFDEEVGELGLLRCGTPSHVDLEHVSENSLTDVKRETTQEDGEEECPLEVFVDGVQQTSLTNTVSHDSEGNVSETVEDDDDGEPNLP